jgi:ribosomal protein S18 acetylase RimI-like enzyme
MKVRRASVQDVHAVAQLLGKAFAADPYMAWLARADDRRAEAFERYFRLGLELTIPHGEVYVTEAGDGAALWAPPHRWDVGFLRLARLLPQVIKITGGGRLLELVRAARAVGAAHPPEPHYFLFAVGVDPASRGRGLGPALLAPVLARCDREGVGAYLETANEQNLGLYQRLGFEITAEATISKGPVVRKMWRRPATSG